MGTKTPTPVLETINSVSGVACRVKRAIDAEQPSRAAYCFSAILSVDYGVPSEVISIRQVYYVVDPDKAIAIAFR